MKKAACLVLALVLLFAITIPGYARDGGHFDGGHFRGGGHFHGGGHFRGADIWFSPGWAGWGPWWWGPPYYPYYDPYYPYYPQTPAVIQQQPPVYVEPAPQPEDYWYFCQDPQGYYPYIKKCPGGWLKVVPPSPPDEED